MSKLDHAKAKRQQAARAPVRPHAKPGISEPASERQVAYLRALYAGLGVRVPISPSITRRDASQRIEALQKRSTGANRSRKAPRNQGASPDSPVDRRNYPPTPRQLTALAVLCRKAGRDMPDVATIADASKAIGELKRDLGQNTGRRDRSTYESQRKPRQRRSTQ